MNKGFKSVLAVLGYLMVYFSADMLVGLLAGVIYGMQHPISTSDEIITDALYKSIEQFYFSNINIFIIISSLIALSIYLLIFKIKKQSFRKYMNFSSVSLKDAGTCCLLGISISVFLSSLFMLTSIHELFPIHSEVVDIVIGKQSVLISILSIGIIVPIFEEILFRGLVFNRLKNDLNIYFAILAQALIFGLFHGNTLQIIYTFFGGIILALSYIWIKSIWAPILIHMFWNTTSVFIGFVNVGGQTSFAMAFILSVVLIIYTVKQMRNSKRVEELIQYVIE